MPLEDRGVIKCLSKLRLEPPHSPTLHVSDKTGNLLEQGFEQRGLFGRQFVFEPLDEVVGGRFPIVPVGLESDKVPDVGQQVDVVFRTAAGRCPKQVVRAGVVATSFGGQSVPASDLVQQFRRRHF